MAEIIMGIGTSHTPLLTFEATRWQDYVQRDYKSERLNTSDGRWLTYKQLEDEVQAKYASVATLDHFRSKQDVCQRSLDRLGEDIAKADPDVVVIITDDETELFTRQNTPAVSVYYGEEIITHPRKHPEQVPGFFETMLKTYAMDKPHTFPAMAGFARELIERLIEHDIDIGAASQIDDPHRSGFGHGVGFVVTRIFGDKRIPVVPVLLNTYYPPNVPKPARCHDIGRALRHAIEASPEKLRVAVLASGGLSHFTVDEKLDRRVLEGFEPGKAELLRTLPVPALNSGSSEIRNWIALAGAIEGMTNRWLEYQPLYRTPAGTGIGVAFGIWS
jgi:aromatic ring-opening dioxygenase catalytic subunit (LigB family)